MFENLNLPHIPMVLMIAMLLFGAKRIPEIAGWMGKGIKEFKRNISEATRDETPNISRIGNAAPAADQANPMNVEEEIRSGPKWLS